MSIGEGVCRKNADPRIPPQSKQLNMKYHSNKFSKVFYMTYTAILYLEEL